MKRILSALIAISLLAMTACSSENSDKFYGKNDSSSSSESNSSDTSGSSEKPKNDLMNDYDTSLKDLSEYIDLGEYKDLEYEFDETIYDVPDIMIKNAIASSLELELADTGQPAKKGDIVNIDFAGTVDGEKFDGCEAENFEFILGSHKFPDDFENAIENMAAGSEKDIKYTFPETYSDTKIAGKEADFHITLNSVSEYDESQITDDLIKEKTKKESYDEYKAYITDMMRKNAEAQKNNNIAGILITKIIDSSTIKGYDEEELKKYIDLSKASTTEAAKAAGVTEEEYVKNTYGLNSYEEYEKSLEEKTKQYIDNMMVVKQIAFKENLTITDDDYKKQVETMAESNNMTVEELGEYYASTDIITSMIAEKVQNWLLENSKNTFSK